MGARGRQPVYFIDHGYSRAHRWQFAGCWVLFSNPAAVDPEEAFVGALSSCHILWFLDLAARDGLVVNRYADHANGYLTKREDGKIWLVRDLHQMEFPGKWTYAARRSVSAQWRGI